MGREPIPLRALTVLLNYEFVISDPRFFNVKLVKSSLADPAMITRLRANPSFAEAFRGVPNTIEKTTFQIFDQCRAPTVEYPSTICLIHPGANKRVKAFSIAQRELLYYHTRYHDGCYKAGGLYQFFFELCPGQKISIQLTDEEPIIIDLKTGQLVKLQIHGPKLTFITTITSGPPFKTDTYNNGQKNNEPHLVVMFPHPQYPDGIEQRFVVDMTRMQYGEAGRGLHGENYLLGTSSQFHDSMNNICAQARVTRTLSLKLESNGNENEQRLRACAKKAWERWQNRDTEAWCAFCGKPGRALQECSECTTQKVFYCCKEHRKSDEKLHEYTCEKNQK
ncbi:hypothetical protein N431DRAFT_543395 [Stipitochalara longipes BDJ]|nr:hypothetical protein N431DRAFT_543395 [Stipitochalara longipes BDJ]